MTSIEVFLQYEDIFGKAATQAEFAAVMRSLDRALVLRLFAAVNSICSRRGLPEYESAQIGLLREIFNTPTIRLVEDHMRAKGRFVTVFHRKQCLFLMREAMRLCDEIPGQERLAAQQNLARASLMASQLSSALAPKGSSHEDAILGSMCDFIPIAEANELKFDFSSVPRMHKILSDLAPSLAGRAGYFDIPTLFEQASGIALKTYEALFLAILPRILESAKDIVAQSPFYGVPLGFFSQTKLPAADRDTFFSLISRTGKEFKERLSKGVNNLSDFTVFKETPFFHDTERLVPLDTALSIEKFESSVFWTIFSSLPNKDKEPFTSFWGQLFEQYVQWLLAVSVDGSLNLFYPAPRYTSGNRDEVCDGLVVCGTTAIFIECKGGFVRGDAKYGGDPLKLREELNKKYVKPKGVFQLAKTITKALNRNDPALIEGVDLSGIRTIIPLLITRDDIGDGFFTNYYFNLRFEEAKAETNLTKVTQPVFCTKLISISVDVLEKVSPYLADTRLASILSDRLMNDPELLVPFFMKPVPSITNKPTRPLQALRDINSRLSAVVAEFLEINQKPQA